MLDLLNQESLLKECQKYEDKSIFYSIKDKTIFSGKTVSIFGGGDSALDWAVELSSKSKVNLVHRRDEFRGAKSTLDKVYELEKAGKNKFIYKISIKNCQR